MPSIAPRYYCQVRNQSFDVIAHLDSWEGALTYTKRVNDVGSASLNMLATDDRVDLFELDGLFEIYRSVKGIGIDWYQEFIGLFRGFKYTTSENGERFFTAIFLDLYDLLARTIINYVSATIKSYKYIEAETAMKEYVEENCGASATVGNGREIDGILPNFLVDTDLGLGASWEGDRSMLNVLDILKDISEFSGIDFGVDWDPLSENFIFKTYIDQYGEDRTIVGLNAVTGKNSAGNVPIVFSVEKANVKNLIHEYDRSAESNVVSVLGDGDGATRHIEVRSAPTTADSPWNRREVSRPKNGFTSEMQNYGDEQLNALSSKEKVDFNPLQQESCMYGRDYFLGDRVTVKSRSVILNKKIVEISNNVSDIENISVKFADA
jgi:hypothetical protein